MKKLAFTICSNNYLSQAITLSNSFKKYNSDIRFIICLVDKKENAKQLIENFDVEILEIEEVIGEKIYDLASIYDITELNTAVKPSIFKYLFNKNEDVKSIMYYDPDIMFFNPITELAKLQDEYNVILTPHITTPNDNLYGGGDIQYIQYGVFNLGFLSLTRSDETFRFLDWWEEKLLNGGAYNNTENNLFTDQLWVNLAVAFFEKHLVFKNLGYNMAHWNLHERTINTKDNQYFVNDTYPLVFFHYSGYKLNKAEYIPYTEMELTERPDIVEIFKEYKDKLLLNKIEEFSKISCFYKTRINALNQKNEIPMIKRIFKYVKKYPLFLLRKDFWVSK